MKAILLALALALVLLAAQANAWAQAAADHGAHHANDLASGEVRRIDRAQNKVTLRHGELKSVEMPAMTMAFTVREPKQLDPLKVGDKVVFKVVKQPDGALVVTDIKAAP
jgi:Cu(I)/Ag(I) efflux system periplasmic protein CusF